ncbi:MAG: RNA polymerase sigma factor [Ignavibacteriaceae bacterium]
MTIEEEKQILKRIKDDPKVFGEIFDFYYSKIFGYIFRRILDYDISKDIAAETFLKAYLNIGKFVWKDISIKSWLYKIATNEINYYFRKKKYSPESLNDLLENNPKIIFEENEFESEKQKIENELKLHKDFIKIQRKVILLPVKYQEVISLRFFEQKSIKEISEILNKKNGTIKSLISRGLAKLRNET